MPCISEFIPVVTAVEEEIVAFENAVFLYDIFFCHFTFFAAG